MRGRSGEIVLIDAIRSVLAIRPDSGVVRWLGDDAAVVRAGGVAVVSTDVMVDGTHFRLGQASFEDAGWRALAGALSPPQRQRPSGPTIQASLSRRDE